ncbi:MAG TPA: NADH-quinone oxidoreductase subunit NuoE, partial [Burkholderiaceae bacterium]|nr:NADH-quinone oxidoreductase subunit NuoE [Burkholderiaceae bacterium]
SEQAYKQIDREIAKFPADRKRSAVIAALAIAQDEKGWLSPEVMQDVAEYLDMPAIAVQEVASFYNMFNTQPVGRHKISICTNLPCALSGGERAANYLKEKFGIDFRETTADGEFTLIETECLGACGDAPVLLVNNKRMCSHMSHEKIDALVEELKK